MDADRQLDCGLFWRRRRAAPGRPGVGSGERRFRLVQPRHRHFDHHHARAQPGRIRRIASERIGLFGGDEFYDPSTAQWTAFTGPSSRGGFAVLATGQILAAGTVFYVNARPYPIEETGKAAELWDLSTLAWTSTGSLNQSRISQTMTLLFNGQVLAAGGETFDKNQGRLVPSATAELYTP